MGTLVGNPDKGTMDYKQRSLDEIVDIKKIKLPLVPQDLYGSSVEVKKHTYLQA